MALFDVYRRFQRSDGCQRPERQRSFVIIFDVVESGYTRDVNDILRSNHPGSNQIDEIGPTGDDLGLAVIS